MTLVLCEAVCTPEARSGRELDGSTGLSFLDVPARARLTLCVALALLAVAVAASVAWKAGQSTASSSTGFEGAIRPAGIDPQPLTGLRDEDGRPISLDSLRGGPVVVTFMYTTCKDTCPLTAQQIRGALDDVGKPIPVLAVSVDPKNDTPARAKAFLVKQQMIGRMHFLLGSSKALERQWRAYGIQPQGKGLEHSAYVILLDGRGVQRIGFPADQLVPEQLAHDIKALLARPMES
jgi:protein SCO1/2